MALDSHVQPADELQRDGVGMGGDAAASAAGEYVVVFSAQHYFLPIAAGVAVCGASAVWREWPGCLVLDVAISSGVEFRDAGGERSE